MHYGKGVEEYIKSLSDRGELDRIDAFFEAENPACGDRLRIELKIECGIIIGVRWRASGCPPTLAAAEVLRELCEGKKISDACSIDAQTIVAKLPGLPDTSNHAADLAIETLRGALSKCPIIT